MEQRLSVLTLGVADLARSRRFYVDGLGWQPFFETEEVVFFQLGGMVLAVWLAHRLLEDMQQPAAQPAPGGVALGHNVRAQNEVDALLAQAEAAGATILKPGSMVFWGGYTGYFADPDGHAWEVAWNPGWPLDAEGRVRVGGADASP
jgi:uncharacterized protein